MIASAARIQTLDPLPARLLAEPFDFMVADHHRHRVLCHLCERLADADQFEPAVAGAVVGHIETELRVHIVDEEMDLFPMLRKRAKPDDDILPVLDHLSEEHFKDEKLAARIVNGLRRRIGDPDVPMSSNLRRTLRTFAATERRHLAIENAIVIPLARVRLSTQDVADLAEQMAARRGRDRVNAGERRPARTRMPS